MTQTPLAILDGVPTYIRGLQNALAPFDFDPEAPSDLKAWAPSGPRAVVVISIESQKDMLCVADIRKHWPDFTIVALLQSPTVDAYRVALVAGADGAASWRAPTDYIVEVIRAAVHGGCLLPSAISRAIASGESNDLGPEEIRWLQALAAGSTVTALAHDIGYSEREMYRKLRRLYKQMKVGGRSEAIVKAVALGYVGGGENQLNEQQNGIEAL